MGLDIYIYRPEKIEINSLVDDDNLFRIDQNPDLEIFSEFIFEKDFEYHNLEEPFKELGISEKDCRWLGTEYNKGVTFEFINTGHRLYELYEWVDDNWDHWFPSMKELRASELYKKYDKDFRWLLNEHGWTPRWKHHSHGLEHENITYNFIKMKKFVEKQVIFYIKNPPTIKKRERVLFGKEIGWQRKGANSLFYEENIWDTPAIANFELLKFHWEKYFSNKTPDSLGGLGSGTEFNLKDTEMRERFKKNILDKFVQGETFVAYQ